MKYTVYNLPYWNVNTGAFLHILLCRGFIIYHIGM